MSMEFFTWPWMKKFLEKIQKFKYKHITSSLSLYLMVLVSITSNIGCMKISKLRRKIERNGQNSNQFTPDKDYDGMIFAKDGGLWQGQLHIYQMPFYYIDYTLAQTCAFQFWIKNEKDSSLAWKNYLNLCRRRKFILVKLVNLAKLTSPFEEGCLQAVV